MKRTDNIPVVDPFCAADDPEMPSIATALDPDEAQRQFEHRLGHLAGEDGSFQLREIRVARYKPGRRCVIEYDLEQPEAMTLLGKVRVRRFGKSGYRLLSAFWNSGFDADAPDGIAVPEPVGTVSKFRMWLQRKVPGQAATDLLAAGDVDLARRIAEAAHKVHRAGVPTERRHTMADELRILHKRLPTVGRAEPRWADRIERLLEACDRLGTATPEAVPRGIHRDFYADQVIVDGPRLHLIDFDLYCEGDPALDIGNFLGHLTEQSLRTLGDPEALAHVERALEERFVELSGGQTCPAIHAYKLLTLARHVHLSTLYPERRSFTRCLLELCEELFRVKC
jgi:Phosphotransferase enzyme family